MILINSAAYVISELQVEYGKLPPCMLPLGNKRLFQHQIEAVFADFNIDEQVYISLPADFNLSSFDKNLLDRYNVSVVPVPAEFTLGQALLYVLNVVNTSKDRLYMLHGDTLISPITLESDVIGVSTTQDNYDWQLVSQGDSNEVVWCGYFSFSDVQLLVQSLALNRGDFVDSIESYREIHNLSLKSVDKWYDLGHLNTYFKSRAAITTQRAFNELCISNGIVKKSGSPPHKISAEALWFQNIPVKLKKFVPQLISSTYGTSSAHYELEYLPLPPLNEIYVYGLNPPFFWDSIFNSIVSFMNTSKLELDVIEKENCQNDFVKLVEQKSLARLEQYASLQGLSLYESYAYNGSSLGTLSHIVKKCVKLTLDDSCFPCVIHGDLCFSNILFDSRSGALKLVDPRGMNLDGNPTIYGDQKYDLAKLAHSVIGMYDFIIAGRYQLVEVDKLDLIISFDDSARVNSIQKIFMNTEFIPGYDTTKILPLVVLLFLSMLPLHNDRPDRQRAMFVNALRIYRILEGDVT